MRRTLYLLAGLVFGAASAASAQASPVLLARRDVATDNPRGLLVHVSGLLDDPDWMDQLTKGYTIHLHWTVQLWRPRFLGADPQPKQEWDTEIQAKTTVLQYVYTTRVAGRPDEPLVFNTLDSLKAWLSTDVPLRGPPRLDAGDWYYTVNVDVSALTPDQVDQHANGSTSVLGDVLRGLVLGGGKTTALRAPRIPFTVPKK